MRLDEMAREYPRRGGGKILGRGAEREQRQLWD